MLLIPSVCWFNTSTLQASFCLCLLPASLWHLSVWWLSFLGPCSCILHFTLERKPSVKLMENTPRLAFQLLHRLGRGLLEESFHSDYHMSQNLQCYYSRVSELVLGPLDMNVPQTTQIWMSLKPHSHRRMNQTSKLFFLHQLKVKTNKINKWLSSSLLQHQKPTISPSIKAQSNRWSRITLTSSLGWSFLRGLTTIFGLAEFLLGIFSFFLKWCS